MNISRLRQALDRQEKGLTLLNMLQRQEFSFLKDRDPDNVFQIEFSIQELLRQIAVEWDGIKEMVCTMAGKATGLRMFIQGLDDALGRKLQAQVERIGTIEKRCAAQATMNADMAVALVDQGQGILDFLCKELNPTCRNTYSAKGRWNNERGGPGLIKGNL